MSEKEEQQKRRHHFYLRHLDLLPVRLQLILLTVKGSQLLRQRSIFPLRPLKGTFQLCHLRVHQCSHLRDRGERVGVEPREAGGGGGRPSCHRASPSLLLLPERLRDGPQLVSLRLEPLLLRTLLAQHVLLGLQLLLVPAVKRSVRWVLCDEHASA